MSRGMIRKYEVVNPSINDLGARFTAVSFSGGKDSTAMLLHMIELGEHIDEVFNCDTGMEFPEMYDHISQVREIVEGAGIKFTTIRSPHSFEYFLLEKPIKSKKHGDHKGYGWPTPVIRWCTSALKRDLIDNYIRKLRSDYEVIQCIGLAADELTRLSRPNNQAEEHRHPLVEWGWSEEDCLEYCYSKGFEWNGLYRIRSRVSCWCCPLQSIDSLQKLWKLRPELWARLEDMDEKVRGLALGSICTTFREGYTIPDLAKRFEREDRARRFQAKLLDFGEVEV